MMGLRSFLRAMIWPATHPANDTMLPPEAPASALPAVVLDTRGGPVPFRALEMVRDEEGYGDAVGVRAGRVPSLDHAYLCPAGVWTIGYGTTRWPDGRRVREGDTTTRPKAERMLRLRLARDAGLIDRLVTVRLSAGERAALVSFIYNVGKGAFEDSTLLRLLNAGDRKGAAAQFPRWDKGTVKGVKVVLPGLVTRRAKERKLFEGDA